MAKPEWGIKRICQSCGILFYDFHKSPIICPKCKAEFDPEAVLKSRRTRMPVAEDTKKKEKAETSNQDEDPGDVSEQGDDDGHDGQALADGDGGGEDPVPDVSENEEEDELASGDDDETLLDQEDDD